MTDPEERLRRLAVRRVLAGMAAAAVAAEVHRSERWVFKWLARYDPKDEHWARARSRAPVTVANKSAPELEALVLSVRARLQADPWAQLGATAIAWELKKLGLQALPKSWTIERILRRAKVPRRRRRERRLAKGTPYPAPPALLPNACQEADLIGPRHLAGAIPFFVLTVVDLGRRVAACELQLSKADAPTMAAVIRVWSRLGVPTRLKLDNWLQPSNTRRLSAVVRMCLDQGVIPVFIPFAEPWRNGVVEHFNDTFDKHFFRTEQFRDRTHLKTRMRRFEQFHNAEHRYSALKGATPNEATARAGFHPRLLDPGYQLPSGRPRRGRIEFIRLIRSDRVLRVMAARIALPEAFVYEYVTAVLDVRREVIDVFHLGRRVRTVPFRLDG
ncbi:MAG TPA: integrase core domain-containing protein [Candidatus Limnocylindria bacterium]|nr:integrase core domain-containing protein [Candidatus Limnocylindria bacterium]